jgi:hypothetical protein
MCVQVFINIKYMRVIQINTVFPIKYIFYFPLHTSVTHIVSELSHLLSQYMPSSDSLILLCYCGNINRLVATNFALHTAPPHLKLDSTECHF